MEKSHLLKREGLKEGEEPVIWCDISNKRIFPQDLSIFRPYKAKNMGKVVCPHCGEKLFVGVRNGEIESVKPI